MFCPKCGKECNDRVNFCCHCGAPIAAESGRPPIKLARSKTDKKIAGVCGGFAEDLDMDPTLVRLIWVMLALLGGWGVLGYFVAWLVMPEAPVIQAAADVSSSAATPTGAQQRPTYRFEYE